MVASRRLTFNTLVLNCGLSSCEWKSQKQQFLPGRSTTEAAVSESSPYRVPLSRWNIQSVLAHPDNASSRGFSAIQANLSTPIFFFFLLVEVRSWFPEQLWAVSIRWTSQISLFVLEPDLNLAFPLYSLLHPNTFMKNLRRSGGAF